MSSSSSVSSSIASSPAAVLPSPVPSLDFGLRSPSESSESSKRESNKDSLESSPSGLVKHLSHGEILLRLSRLDSCSSKTDVNILDIEPQSIIIVSAFTTSWIASSNSSRQSATRIDRIRHLKIEDERSSVIPASTTSHLEHHRLT